jgi:hypothetical protein
VFFASATLAFYGLGLATVAAAFGAIVMLHYLFSFDRVRWLVAR